MHHPQPGIFSQGTPENIYLEIDLERGAAFIDLVEALANTRGYHGEYGANVVIGFRPSRWRALRPAEMPADAEDWTEPIVGEDGYTMPATPHDAWIWVSGADRAQVFDNVLSLRNAIKGIAEVATETVGWHYEEGRDLTGFIDGTKNPDMVTASDVCTVSPDQPGSASSVLVFQLWPHDIPAWMGLSQDAQERVIGRSKPDSVELPADVMPPTSHVSRTTVHRDGEELKIFRHNVAFGDTGSHGTVFVGFSSDQWRQMEMLKRMAGVGDGVRDALTRFSRPVTGATYVIPSATVLREYVKDDQ